MTGADRKGKGNLWPESLKNSSGIKIDVALKGEASGHKEGNRWFFGLSSIRRKWGGGGRLAISTGGGFTPDLGCVVI